MSEKYAALSDGLGNLMILDTGDRQKSDEWKCASMLQPLHGTGFILQDAKLMVERGEKLINCLLLHIEQTDGKFFNIIDWITLKQSEGEKSWEETARRTLQGKGSLHYLSLDPRCTSIVYSSNHEYKYTLDTVNEIVVEAEPNRQITEDSQPEQENLFQWKQNGEDITINFKRSSEATKDQFNVNCRQSHIDVKCAEEVLINSDLFAEIDTDLTTWTLEENFMQLNLVKRDSDLIWPYLIPGGPPMSMSVDGAQPDLMGNAPVSDLNSQMEECDFGGHQDDEFFIGNKLL